MQINTINVRFKTFKDVNNFISLTSKYPYSVTLTSGRYVVDGKSIMGLYSLNLAHPIKCQFETEIPDELYEELEQYIEY